MPVCPLGNDAFHEGNFSAAIVYFSDSISLHVSNDSIQGLLFANRSLCYLKLGQYEDALNDAEVAIKLKNNKGYLRKAAACKALQLINEANRYAAIAFALDNNLKKDATFVKEFFGTSAHVEQAILITPSANDLPEDKLSNLDKALQSAKENDIFVFSEGVHIVSMGEIKSSITLIGLGEHAAVIRQRTKVMGVPAVFEILCSGVVIENLVLSGDQESAIHINTPALSKSLRKLEALFVKSKDELSENRKLNEQKLPFCVRILRCKLLTESKNRQAVITIRSGTLFLTNSQISGNDSGDGLFIRGAESICFLRNTCIEKATCIAVNVSHGGRVLIENCILSKCDQGIVAWQHAGCIQVFNSIIRENCAEGVLLSDPMWNNDLDYTSFESRRVKPTSFVGLGSINNCFIFRDCQIVCNRGYGLTLQEASQMDVSIDRCRIISNGLWGLFIQGGVACSISRSRFVGNACGGIRIGLNYDHNLSIVNSYFLRNFGFAIFSELHDPPRRSHFSSCYMDSLQKFKKDILNNQNLVKPAAPYTRTPICLDNVCLFNSCSLDHGLRAYWFQNYEQQALSFSSEQTENTNEYFSNILNDPSEDLESHTQHELFSAVTFCDPLKCAFCYDECNLLEVCNTCKKANYCSEACRQQDEKRHALYCTEVESGMEEEKEIVLSLTPFKTDQEDVNQSYHEFAASDALFYVCLTSHKVEFDEPENQMLLELTFPPEANPTLSPSYLKHLNYFQFKLLQIPHLYDWVMLFGLLDPFNLICKRFICLAQFLPSSKKRKTLRLFLHKQ